MSDLPIALALLAVAWAAWQRPWVGVLGLVFVGLMSPQSYATGWLQGAPAYLGMLVVVTLATVRQFVVERRWPTLDWDWRFAVAGLLALQMLLSTWVGINPWAGWGKLAETAKMLPLLALVVILIDDRDKLRWLLITIGLSIGAVVLKGGFFALFMGFGERVYGPPGSQFHDNNEFAVATAMAIPLLVLWLRQVNHAGMRVILGALIALSFASALSSWSRGGLLCVATVAALLAMQSRRKWLALAALVAAAGLAFAVLPQAWFDRMQTLAAPASEGSAAGRLEVWRIGIEYMLQRPWTGGGLGSGLYVSLPTGGPMAFHSAYVGVAVEHGLPGLLLWCTLLFGTFAELMWLWWRAGRRGTRWLADLAGLTGVSLAAYAVGSAFLSVQYWELLYLIVVAGILIRRASRQVPAADREALAVELLSERLTVASAGPRRNPADVP